MQRTPVVIATKDEMRNAAEQLIRQYATLIKYNAGMSNPEKIAIGVRPTRMRLFDSAAANRIVSPALCSCRLHIGWTRSALCTIPMESLVVAMAVRQT